MVTFNCGNTTSVNIANNSQSLLTSRGSVVASDLQQGDKILLNNMLVEITTIPVVS